MELFVKLILAHLIGDFLLQTKSMVEAKEKRKLLSWQLYFHVFLHVAVTALLLWDKNEWTILVAVFASHLIIDALKVYLQKDTNRRGWFILDQLLHFLALYLIFVFHDQSAPLIPASLSGKTFWIGLTAVFFLTRPASMIIKIVISYWNPQKVGDDESLEEAGNVIGILERLLIFGFVIAGHWEAVGFLLAAKSIFRFGDLRAGTERKLTEYVLIGTLLSFGMALAVGAVFNLLT